MKAITLFAAAALLSFGCSYGYDNSDGTPLPGESGSKDDDEGGNTPVGADPGTNPGTDPGTGTPTLEASARAVLDAAAAAELAAESAEANAEDELVAATIADANQVITLTNKASGSTIQFSTAALAVAQAATSVSACSQLVFVADLAAGLVNEEPPAGYETTVYDAIEAAAGAAATAAEAADDVGAADVAANAEAAELNAEAAAAPIDEEGNVVAALEAALETLACP
ncbi:MAG: hypothetical protein MJE77_42360 [Proteobacteria bacterium]|nr:hypothetical protein [Pseudomonadota bacterium]